MPASVYTYVYGCSSFTILIETQQSDDISQNINFGRSFSPVLAGSKVIGLRGSTVVDHHIGALLSVFLNTTRSTEWIRSVTGFKIGLNTGCYIFVCLMY